MAQDDQHTSSKQGRLCQRRCAHQARRTAISLSRLVSGSTGAINSQYHASRAFAATADTWQASITHEGDDARLHAAVANLIQGATRLLPPLALLVGADQHSGCDGVRLKSAVPRLDHEGGRSLALLTLFAGANHAEQVMTLDCRPLFWEGQTSLPQNVLIDGLLAGAPRLRRPPQSLL